MPTSMVTGKKIDVLNEVLTGLDPRNQHLGLFISDNRISLCFTSIQSPVQKIVLPLKDSVLSEILNVLESGGKDFHTATAFIATKEITLVPEGVFQPSSSQQYLDSVFGTSRSEIFSQHLEELEIHSLFRMEVGIYASLINVFPQLHVHHIMDAILMETKLNRSFRDSALFRLHKEADDLFLMVYRGKNLELFNVHHIGDPTDLVYHTLNTMELCEVDHSEVDIECSGDMKKSTESFDLLSTYCPQIKYRKGEEIEKGLEEEFVLAHQLLCVS